MATASPARVINRLPKLGTLQVGAPSGVTVLDIVVAGVAFGRPYQAPFTVR